MENFCVHFGWQLRALGYCDALFTFCGKLPKRAPDHTPPSPHADRKEISGLQMPMAALAAPQLGTQDANAHGNPWKMPLLPPVWALTLYMREVLSCTAKAQGRAGVLLCLSPILPFPPHLSISSHLPTASPAGLIQITCLLPQQFTRNTTCLVLFIEHVIIRIK